MTPMTELQLSDLHQRHPGLTPAMAQMFFEAASICLSRHHSRPNDLQIRFLEGVETQAVVDWQAPTPGLKAAYANTIDTTEWGAYGVSLAAIELKGLVAVQRAETLSGADYYVAPIGSEIDDLEEALRLEVSGTDTAGSAGCYSRLQKKIDQTKNAAHDIPAVASVVGFCQKLVLVSEVIAP
jgi:hypothetical protein